jgi:hypothetical protein
MAGIAFCLAIIAFSKKGSGGATITRLLLRELEQL